MYGNFGMKIEIHLKRDQMHFVTSQNRDIFERFSNSVQAINLLGKEEKKFAKEREGKKLKLI